MALDLVLQRVLDEAERVDVLDLGFGAEFFLSARPHADVGVAAQRTFFHVAVADAGVEDDFFKPREVLVSFLWRSHVGFADDLGQGHAGPVQIDGSLVGSVGEALVQALARVFFEVQPGNADFLFAAVQIDFDESELSERLVILRDLVALRQVRIKVILPRKDGNFVDAALQSHRRQSREFHGLPVQHGQGSRKP